MENNIKERQEILPAIAINMEHKIMLSERQKELLLEERQHTIIDCFNSLQNNFLKIGRALGEIRKFKLYKADPLYNTWAAFIRNRLASKLHQSTITDYISIVNMQEENNDFMKEEDIINIGYKKIKLLKSKLSLIKKEEDPIIREKLKNITKNLYKQSLKELKDIPYSTYVKVLNERLSTIKKIESKKTNAIIEKENNSYACRLDKQRKKITINIKKGSPASIEELFSRICALES